MLGRQRWSTAGLAALMVAGGLLTACTSEAGTTPARELEMAPLHEMPMDVQSAPVVVQEAYQFAVANASVLTELPCYCGCGAIGHHSNYDCYVDGMEAAGTITYDRHALGCQVCVDITQDTMRLMREGRSLSAIQKHVDLTYARYGPSNRP